MAQSVELFLQGNSINQITNTSSPLQQLLKLCKLNILNPAQVNSSLYLLAIVYGEMKYALQTNMYGVNLDSVIENFLQEAKHVLDVRAEERDAGPQFAARKLNLRIKLEALITAVKNTETKPAIEELLFYEYARTGEASLNQEVSNLGDALSALSSVVRQLNRLESILAINPGEEFINERGELLITLNKHDGSTASNVAATSNNSLNFFYNRTEFTNVETNGSGNNMSAMSVLVAALNNLTDLIKQLPEDSEHYKAINTVIKELDTKYEIRTWVTKSDFPIESKWADREGGNSLQGELYWKTQYAEGETSPKNFARLFMDHQFRKAVGDAISIAQSQNDIQKQQLSKSLFIYQEFIKSSASLMDMTFKTSKSIANRMAR